jgi:hypothetical protein
MSGRESNYASSLAKAEHDLLNIQNNLLAAPEVLSWFTSEVHGVDSSYSSATLA